MANNIFFQPFVGKDYASGGICTSISQSMSLFGAKGFKNFIHYKR